MDTLTTQNAIASTGKNCNINFISHDPLENGVCEGISNLSFAGAGNMDTGQGNYHLGRFIGLLIIFKCSCLKSSSAEEWDIAKLKNDYPILCNDV